MTRIQTLVVTMALAFVLPVGAAYAQTPSPSVANPARILPSSPEDVPSPMQEQAMVPNAAPVTSICGPHSSVIKDEFGRTYNCRGDRIR